MRTMDLDFRLDLLDLRAVTGTPGRLGMCRLPGYDIEDLPADLAALEAAGAAVVVSLIETAELYLLLGMAEPDSGLFPRMARASFRHRHFPIRNGGVPDSPLAFAALVDDLCRDLTADGTVVLHCVAGHGRTGLAAACVLVRLGLAPDHAITTVRARRPGTIETAAQAAYVADYARSLGHVP